MATYMDYVNRDAMAMTSQQALTSGDWDFKIVYPEGKIMYTPPDEIIHVRSKGITGVEPIPTVPLMQIEMRGYTLLQPGKVQTKPNPVSIDVQDFEDQAIIAWLWDWTMKMNNLKNLSSNHRKNLFCDLIIWQLNNNRVPVWEYHYYNALPDGSQFQVQFDGEKNPLGSGTITFNAEFMIPKPLNVGVTTTM